MTSKAEKKRKARAAKAKAHPMSAGVREPNGQRSRRVHLRDQADCGPTPELKRHLLQAGPTCMIQRAAIQSAITPDEARALEKYRKYRAAKLSTSLVAIKPGILARVTPEAGGGSDDDGRIEVMARMYEVGYAAIKATGNRRAASQCGLVCEGYMWADAGALKAGASALKAVYIDGR